MHSERYYSASEVAKILSVSKQTLIRYEAKEIFPKAKRNKLNGWREYTEKDITALKKIIGRGI
ncbi:MAG: MerR family transcriptional regulator [Candidatus Omnitrophota bacterium]|nr:MAG: MerR family transcriptional regulator [Candidatus Omnitrophota bacterium]